MATHTMAIHKNDNQNWYLQIRNINGVLNQWLFRPDNSIETHVPDEYKGLPQSVIMFSKVMSQSEKSELDPIHDAILQAPVLINPLHPPPGFDLESVMSHPATLLRIPEYPPGDPNLLGINEGVIAEMDGTDRLLAMWDVLLDLGDQPGITLLDAIAEVGEDLLIWVAASAMRTAGIPLPRATNKVFKFPHMQGLAKAIEQNADFTIAFSNYTSSNWKLYELQTKQNTIVTSTRLPGKVLPDNSGMSFLSLYESYNWLISEGYTNIISYRGEDQLSFIQIGVVVPQHGPGGLGPVPYWKMAWHLATGNSSASKQLFLDPAALYTTPDVDFPWQITFTPVTGHSVCTF